MTSPEKSGNPADYVNRSETKPVGYSGPLAAAHRLKARYQINMIEANLVVAGLCFAVAISLDVSSRDVVKTVHDYHLVMFDTEVYKGGRQDAERHSSKTSQSLKGDRPYHKGGFAGLRGYKVVVSDDWYGGTVSEIAVSGAPILGPDIQPCYPAVTGGPHSYGGALYGHDPALPEHSLLSDWSRRLANSSNVMIPGSVLHEPPVVLLASPRWPERVHSSDTGIVRGYITINSDGTASFELVSETPPRRGFAESVIRALRRSTFFPGTDERGYRITVRVPYQCIFLQGGVASVQFAFGQGELTTPDGRVVRVQVGLIE